jgi:6-phosphofructokinase
LHHILSDIVRAIADVVEARAAVGKNYGTMLIPEGLVDSIPELHSSGKAKKRLMLKMWLTLIALIF